MVVGVVEDAVMVRPPLRDCVEYCGFTLLGEVAVASFGSSLPVHRPHRFRQCSRKFIFASRKCVWSHQLTGDPSHVNAQCTPSRRAAVTIAKSSLTHFELDGPNGGEVAVLREVDRAATCVVVVAIDVVANTLPLLSPAVDISVLACGSGSGSGWGLGLFGSVTTAAVIGSAVVVFPASWWDHPGRFEPTGSGG